MNEDHVPNEDSSSQQGGPAPQGGSAPQSQEVRHSQVSALVPESVGRGVFSTGAVVLQGAHEFILDFLQRMSSPRQLAARVVLPPAVVARLIAALRENLANYERHFGRPAALPQPGQTASQASSDSTPAGQPQQAVSPGTSQEHVGILPPQGAPTEGQQAPGQSGMSPTDQPPQQSQTQQLPHRY